MSLNPASITNELEVMVSSGMEVQPFRPLLPVGGGARPAADAGMLSSVGVKVPAGASTLSNPVAV